MMSSLGREDRIGLAVALGLHLALVLAFVLQGGSRADIARPQRMTVNLTGEVGLEAAAPVPVPESRAAIAPALAETPAAPPPAAGPRPAPPPPRRIERPVAARAAAPAAAARPRPAPAEAAAPAPARSRSGGTRVGQDFLSGLGASATTAETRAPASAIGASERASLFQAIARAIKPQWQPPSGPEVDRIVTKVRFRLNRDGSLAGRPQLAGQRGVNAINRAQAGRHGEQAIRAVQLAAPFDLPERYYDDWKTVTVDFDWKLAQ